MTPVVGLDVAKRAIEGQACLDKGRLYGPAFQIVHTQEGLARLQTILDDLAAQTGCPPTVILDSTGPYHVPVVRFLEDHAYAYILLNPLIPYQAKQSSLRKVKTDAVDAYGYLLGTTKLPVKWAAIGIGGSALFVVVGVSWILYTRQNTWTGTTFPARTRGIIWGVVAAIVLLGLLIPPQI